MKNTLICIFASLLMAFVPTVALAQIHTSSSREMHSFGGGNMSTGASAPTATFRSTSTGIPTSTTPAVGFKKMSSVPSLNAGGTALNPYSQSSGPRKERGTGTEGGNAGTPGATSDGQIPVGGPLFPLLLLAGGYAALTIRNKKKQQ